MLAGILVHTIQATHFAGESGYTPDQYSEECRDTPYHQWPEQSVVMQGD
jgi:hypothetical protein